jgi:hypothetical protein
MAELLGEEGFAQVVVGAHAESLTTRRGEEQSLQPGQGPWISGRLPTSLFSSLLFSTSRLGTDSVRIPDGEVPFFRSRSFARISSTLTCGSL